MASPQCLGYSRYRTVTRDLCFPPKKDILKRIEEAVKKYRAKAVFVATDSDPMLDELNFRLKGLNVSGQFAVNFCRGPVDSMRLLSSIF